MSDGLDQDLLATIWAALDDTGVWVAPELAGEVSPADLAAIRGAVADSAVPLHVVLQPLTDGDAFGGEPEELLTQLHDRYDADGLYLAPHFYGDFHEMLVVTRTWGTDLDVYEAVTVAEHRHEDAEGRTDNLGAFVADLTRLVADGDAAAAYDAEVAPEHSSSTSTAPGGSSDDPAISGAGLLGIALLTVLVVVVLTAVGSRLVHRRPRAFALPDSVVDQVREAQADRVEQQARTAVLDLGDAIRVADLDAGDDTAGWQAALDHYDAASRVLDGADDLGLLDAVGTLVLARQGRAALSAATDGRPFRPLRLCYLNPLHEAPTRTPTRLEQHGHTLDVPLCRTCRADLKAGRDPDALRVEHGGRTVLYVDSGVEPWASTSYGALGTDLVVALQRLR